MEKKIYGRFKQSTWQLGDARIVMAACGKCHSVVVSAEGRVWTFGCRRNGCLGHNDEQQRLVPTLLAAAQWRSPRRCGRWGGGCRALRVDWGSKWWCVTPCLRWMGCCAAPGALTTADHDRVVGALVQAAVRPGAVLRRLRARPSEACTHLCGEPEHVVCVWVRRA